MVGATEQYALDEEDDEENLEQAESDFNEMAQWSLINRDTIKQFMAENSIPVGSYKFVVSHDPDIDNKCDPHAWSEMDSEDMLPIGEIARGRNSSHVITEVYIDREVYYNKIRQYSKDNFL